MVIKHYLLLVVTCVVQNKPEMFELIVTLKKQVVGKDGSLEFVMKFGICNEV